MKKKRTKLDEALKKRGLFLTGGFRSKEKGKVRQRLALLKKLERLEPIE